MAELSARIIAKASGTASEEPLAADLEVAELAVNTADGKLFTKHTDGSVVTISGGGGGGAVDSVNGETGVVSLGIQDMDDYDDYNVSGSLLPRNYDPLWPSNWPEVASDSWGFGTRDDLGGIDQPQIVVDNTPTGTWTPPQWTGSNLASYRFTFNGSMSFVFSGYWLYQDGGARYIFNFQTSSEYAPMRDAVLAAGANTTLTVEGVTAINLVDGDILQWSDAALAFKPAQLPVAVDSVNGQAGVVNLGIQDMDDYELDTEVVGLTVLRFTYAGFNEGTSISSGEYTYRNNFGDNSYRVNSTDADGIDVSTRFAAGATTIWISFDGATWDDMPLTTPVADQGGTWTFTVAPGEYPFDDGANTNPAVGTVAYFSTTDPGITEQDVPLAEGDILQWVDADQKFKPAQLPDAAATRTLLGIGEYADDAAAGTGGVASGAMYYNTIFSDYRLKS